MTAAANVVSVLESGATLYGDRTCLVAPRGGRTYTYAELHALTDHFCGALAQLGVRPGDFLAVMLPTGPEFVVSSFGIRKRGAVEVAINSEFRGAALARMLCLTEASVLITTPELFSSTAAILHQTPNLRRVVLTGDPSQLLTRVKGVEVLWFQELLDVDLGDSRANPKGDVQAIFFTSGTTGRSKGCTLSDSYAMAWARAVEHMYDATADDCLYNPYPLHHVGGAFGTLCMLRLGGSVALVPKFSLSQFWTEVRSSSSTLVEMYGRLPKLLLDAPPAEDEEQNTLRLVAAYPVPPEAAAFEHRFGVRFVGGYGSTDAGFVSIARGERSLTPTDVGRVQPTHEVAVVDDDDLCLEPGATGEIVVRPRSPGVMSSGYFGMVDETLATRRNLWFHTGDIGMIDDAGHLHFLGRKQERIRRGGENVSAFEVAEALQRHPSVLSAVVAPVPNGLAEDDIYAFVQPPPGSAVDTEALQAFCVENIPKFMIPTHFVVVEDFPLTATGKIALNELMKRALSEASPP